MSNLLKCPMNLAKTYGIIGAVVDGQQIGQRGGSHRL